MSIFQFLRVMWAYRIMILTFAVAAHIAATATVELVTPRYEAQSRVMLDVIKPDPVTGQVMSTAFLRAYTKTQTELIKDVQVARRVVDDLKWSENKEMQREYRERPADQRSLDFHHWAEQLIVTGANANLISGSNILEITFSSPSPTRAKVVADGLRNAYIDMTLQSRRENARRNALWYEQQAEKVRGILFKAEADKSTLERSSGIILQDNKMDLEQARLAALAGQGGSPVVSAPPGSSPSAFQLAELDAQIAQAEKTLGPNHPTLQGMRLKRKLLADQVAREQNAGAQASAAALSAARANAGLVEQQKAKVLSQRETVERLKLMQDEVDLRRDQYNKALARAAQLRQESEIMDSGVVPLAAAITPQEPVFPKKGLTIGVSIPLGAGLGVVIALLLALLSRRIRSAYDLQTVVDAPVLAVLHNPLKPKRRLRLLAWPRPKILGVRAARA
jgi:uncharacterized protein involved in exopolysaccharide biosynthesis